MPPTPSQMGSLGCSRAREDALAGEGWAVLAGPVRVGLVAQLKEKLELFGKEIVVVFELEAEEGKGLDEGAAAGDDLRAASGDEVERGELLKDADGVGGAEDGDGAGEADIFGARGGCGEDDGGRGVEELLAVVLADAEDVEADLIGERHLFQQVAHALLGRGTHAGVGHGRYEAVDANLHAAPSLSNITWMPCD